MRLIIKPEYNDCAIWVANYIVKKITDFNPTKDRPFILGLPTGSTPLGVYKELINMYSNDMISFENVVTFNMDEYVGLDENDKQSYHYYMNENFFNHIDIRKENINILDGMATNIAKECRNYEAKIKEYGKINLFLGGVGSDGHIAFNEPFSSLSSRTRIKILNPITRLDNSRFFGGDINKTPKTALTVGIGTILDSEEVLIMASGGNKAKVIQQAIEGSISHVYPVTALQLHEKAIFVCDREAVNDLQGSTIKYFTEVENINY